ncbi:MAG: phosphatase PAP2 family protein, partial [Thermodesulfovibrionales bacterium]|nr:phosphatase PAP2 family protein [Thermodesulfovibrionales bacterium]
AIIGYIILFPYMNNIFEKGLNIARHSKEEITLLSLIVVLILVIILKAYFGTGHPIRGGMPSGHSAVAFSVSSSITFITQNFNVSIISFLLAGLIAHSRIIIKAHTIPEVIAGALLGVSVTTAMFFIFK